MTIHRSPRVFATAMLAGLSLLLTGCFITPGKFTSELVLMEQDRFSFTYEGEIFFLGLSQLAAMEAAGEEFEATCYADDSFDERECTEEEIAEQRADWEANAAERAASNAQEAEQLATIMGGIDPSDPKASAELVELLLRQEGWERVVDKGNGVFDVRYSVEGELSHDFMFPIIEGFPVTNPFVQMILRDSDVVRVNAPGFSASDESNPMTGMMAGMGGMSGLGNMQAMSSEEGESMPELPVIDGTFTIVTSGNILANNTDEGPSTAANGQMLKWEISPRSSQAPTALIDMSR